MNNIALAMSGGGFRAATFALGTLSYLNELKDDKEQNLLSRVRFISSTSGGSITNIAYSFGICQGLDFQSIYHQLLDTIDGEKIIDRAFKILEDNAVWKKRPDKSRNLINAFSIAYDEMLYPEGYFQLFTDKLKQTHLEEICINATEFANGLTFRFQSQMKDRSSNGVIGNHYIQFKDNSVADRLKLSDILASSSCFPGGFEPLIFPEDFTHSSLSIEKLNDAIYFSDNPFSSEDNEEDFLEDPQFKNNPKRFGLMDGGISDNQAIGSINLSRQRREKPESLLYDLLLITDVTSYFIDSYTLPFERKNLTSHISLLSITQTLFIFGLFCPITIGLSLFFQWYPWMYLVFLPSTFSLSIWIYIKYKLFHLVDNTKREQSTWGLMLSRYSGYFLKLRFSSFYQMLTARLKSVMMINMDIYLKQIRRHYYDQLYKDPKINNLIVSNAIYDLSWAKQKKSSLTPYKYPGDSSEEKTKAKQKLAEICVTSNILIGVAENARLMPTTLWFDKYQRKNNLKESIVATGQFTTCYNLLLHLYEKEIKNIELDPLELTFKTALEADWKKFNADPFWMYNKYGENRSDFHQLKAEQGSTKITVKKKQ